MSDLVIVKFISHHACYNAGESAGFPKDSAEDLIKRKLAILAAPILDRSAVIKNPEPVVKKEEQVVETAPEAPPQHSESTDHGRKGRRR